MNIYSYVDKYGNYTFDEVEFNEIDNAVFASLSYLNLKTILSKNKISIEKVGKLYFEKHSKKSKNVLIVRRAIKLLKYIQNTKRYKDLLLYNYVYKKGKDEQFCALTIEINNKLVYVSFEGTDASISGWREDFMLTYKFPVKAQIRAIDYLNRNFLFKRKKIILGGHSKGGNLALVAGMYASDIIKNKIIKIYNNDGPGLLKEQFESEEYASIKNKLVHIIPNYSIVGLLLYHDKDYIVVKAAKKGAFSHDLFTWVVKDIKFVKTELDTFYKTLSDEIIEWLKKYKLTERERFVKEMFDIFDRANIQSIVDIIENKKLVLKIITESKELNDIDKKMFKDFLTMIFKCFKDVKKDEIKVFLDKKLNKDVTR